jgi:hypothetical protein
LAGKARLLTEIFQCQFDKKEILEKQFPGQPVLAYFKLSPEGQDEEDQKFKREVWKAFLQDGTVNDILAKPDLAQGINEGARVAGEQGLYRSVGASAG